MKRILKFNEHVSSPLIEKVEKYTLDNLNYFMKVGILEPISNAHYFMSNFYNSGDENRRNKNPHNIQYDQMLEVFGEPNFQDDYKDGFWWILDFNDKRFGVLTCETEGSQIYQFLEENKNYVYDKQFSEDGEEFYNQLFKQITS